jgi:hypothetical protein
MPETAPRTVAELRQVAWQAFAAAGKPLTAEQLAETVDLTKGGALRLLTDWHGEARALPLAVTTPAGPYKTPWTTATPPRPPEPSPLRVLVTGSRDWTHTAAITGALDRLHAVHGTRLVIVHGACPKGADAIADRWAHAHQVPVETYPADWNAGRAGGPQRNAAMVATGPGACLAFIRDNSPGATGCARLAEAAGIPTARHTHPAPAAARRTARPAPDVVLAAALDHAAKGRAVFLLGRTKRPVANCPACRDADNDHDPQACDCLTCHGFYAASTDPDRVRAIVAAVPGGLLAMRTGAISDLVVMDIDPRNGGHLLPDLMPPTEAVATGGADGTAYTHPGGYILPQAPRHPGSTSNRRRPDRRPASIHPDTGRLPPSGTGTLEMHPALRDLVTADVAASPAAHTPGPPMTPTTLKRAGCISNPDALLRRTSPPSRAPEGTRRRTSTAPPGVARMVAAEPSPPPTP